MAQASAAHFVISARKYRPKRFGDVLAQPHVTTTLQQAIKNNQLAQAFLFCGPRGVGKTTCARILAKAINCQARTEDTEPCNTCPSCQSFHEGRSLGIYELDAASHNSVEDIRSLVEQVRYPPQQHPYRVYIIDEVHMLSTSAFNAFLKTLEEPPRYAIFILATTEKYKVIPTILSRCQIFDFQRIQPADIMQQLRQIATQEGIVYEEAALHLISQKAEGALRDALSIFDQIVTFGGGHVTYPDTLAHLHVLDYTYYFQLVDMLLAGNTAEVLLLYDRILHMGFDGQHFTEGLSTHLRELLICQDPATHQLLEVATHVQQQYQAQASQVTPDFLLEALRIATQSALHYKTSPNKRLHVELMLIELAQIAHKPDTATPHTPTTPKDPARSTAHTPVSPTHTSPSTHTPTDTTPQPNQEAPAPDATAVSSPKAPDRSASQIAQEAISGVLPPPNQVPAASTLPKVVLATTPKLPKIAELKARMAQAGSQNTTPAVAAPNVARDLSLTKESLQKPWQAYANQLRAAGNMPGYRLLAEDFDLVGQDITVKFSNMVQESTLEEIKEGLLSYLRAQLGDIDIRIRGVLVSPQDNQQPYTAQEKFDYLAKLNPQLQVLKEKLGLALIV